MRRYLSRFACRVLSGYCLLAALALTMHAQSLTFTTFAGPPGGAGSADGVGDAARFNRPGAVATDGGGNLYVADTDNHTIRKITPAGLVTALAGLAGVSGSADGVGGAARFDSPSGMATDSGGNVYVADRNNSTIRKITPAGVVTTLAGSPGLAGSTDGTGSAASFNFPNGVATDGAGNVYVADTVNNTIRKISPAGVVTTLAGSTGVSGSADGTGGAARFNSPYGVAIDSGGNVYVTDSSNHTIRKITPAGVVTTLAGSAGLIGGADGTGSAARFLSPEGVATDSGGNVYVADTLAHEIRKITPAGVVTTPAGSTGVSGSADGTGSDARFISPLGVATDSGGNVYVADTGASTIRKITPAGAVTTLAGSAGHSGAADGTGSAALFKNPYGVATDSGGNVYVADTGANTIRKITPAGAVTTLAGSAADPSGSADGTGSAARFRGPVGVATDSGRNVYVADRDNHTIRKITPAGVVTTLAGSPRVADSADGSGSDARFYLPYGVATDGGGNVYVAEFGNSTIRKITPAEMVTTLAGSASSSGSTDGTGSATSFNLPKGVAADSGGNVYVADFGNRTIRKITPAGVVTTLAGSVGLAGSEDGTGSAARFAYPSGVATDSGGNVYVTDAFDNKICVGRPALADAATIDLSTGTVGTTRQLSTSTQTATSWQWTLIRQPAASAAQLSSTSIRNPVFTPDVADLYIFQLTASNGVTTSITTVSLIATEAPPVNPAPRRRAVGHTP